MITEKVFGQTQDGQTVTLYSISNENGFQADVMNYGAILANLFVPNKRGKVADVTLGYDNLKKYFTNSNFFGASVGPIANRTANAVFEIDGTKYQLKVNDGVNNLHTDFDGGFHKKLWKAKIDKKNNSVIFSLTMEDGELGLPGNREFSITYSVTDDNGLKIVYTGKTDKKTIFNPTNHSYFNLKGHDAGSVLDETLWLNCSKYTKIVPGAIPTGELISVEDTPLDYTKEMPLGARIRRHFEQMTMVCGYDHNYVSDAKPGKLEKIAVLSDAKAGRTMEVYTDMPGIQVYTGNHIGRHLGKGGAHYKRRCGVALETQFFPNSANDEHFTRPLLEPGKVFKSTTIYKFV